MRGRGQQGVAGTAKGSGEDVGISVTQPEVEGVIRMHYQAALPDVGAGTRVSPAGIWRVLRILPMLALLLVMPLLAGCTDADPAPPPAPPEGSPPAALLPETPAMAIAAAIDVDPLPATSDAPGTIVAGPGLASSEASPSPSDTATPVDATIRGARRHVSNGDLAAAFTAYQLLIDKLGDEPLLLFERGIAQLAAGEAGSALEGFRHVLELSPEEPLLGRARLMEATAMLALGEPRGLLALPVDEAPDGLEELLALRRAEAALAIGWPGDALEELSRGVFRESTNRVILRDAARLARQLEAYGLTGELYARASIAPAWTAQRSATMEVAAAYLALAGDHEGSIKQYRALIETYGWTGVAELAADELKRLEGLTPYHAGLLALHQGSHDVARARFAEAAASDEYATRAAARLRELDEAAAWREADRVGTRDAYLSFALRYPAATRAHDALFREGIDLYQGGQISAALAIWDGTTGIATGDNLARLHLWAGIALERLGRGDEARVRLQQAAAVRPAGYYAIRARDRLAGIQGWPATESPAPSGGSDSVAEAEEWIAGWAGEYTPLEISANERARRGLGLVALGLREEATAEMNALIADSDDPNLLFPLALQLAEEELWYPAARAAIRLIGLSPGKAVTEAPAAVQRLVYSLAYWDLVEAETERYGLDPWLFLSLIYQESRYDPGAISMAEARGLTQVIPSTGRGIANALGRTGFDPEQLHRPVTSVQFGTWYLANQLRSFGGHTIKALAAYNAGAGPVGRWASDDLDLFVERIDYPETKSYVRQIYLHHAMYRELGPQDP